MTTRTEQSRFFFGPRALLVLAFGFIAACGSDDAIAPDAADATADVDSGDTAEPEVSPDTTDTTDTSDPGDATDTSVPGEALYGPRPRPLDPLPLSLQSATWVDHWVDDIAPYWTSAVALGTPVGNYPTYRGLDGRALNNSRRRPRMISRQIYTYAMGYMMTGNTEFLAHAHAGVTWLQTHAIDRVKGGCHEQLESDGRAVAGSRTAQDLSYCVLGLAAWYFVTRDPGVEADLLAARNWLFDPNRYWDAANDRIRDGLADDMTTPFDVENDGGAELVAQLDPVNAFMLLIQPVFDDAANRDGFLADLKKLGDIMIRDFHKDGIFWGVDTKMGQYGTRHVDFGHTLKTYWMLLEIDKRLPDHPFHDFIFERVGPLLSRAFDAEFGRWAKRPISASAVEFGSDWWIYAELDQIAATLDLFKIEYLDLRNKTQGHWLTDYVDARFPGEVIPGIKRDGSPVWNWSVTDDAKCNQWKNGFHSTEHALVLSIIGAALADQPVTLHFAFADDPTATTSPPVARPYLFHGRELDRTPSTPLTIGTKAYTPTAIRFTDLY